MPGNRWFFLGTLILSMVMTAVIVLTAPSGTAIPEMVADGQVVWREHGCESCHTLFGQGGAFAPDLTRIYSQRGDLYLRDFLVNPQAYHPDQRVMPSFGLTRTETDSLLSYLHWVGEQPAAEAFPVRTINVSGAALLPGAANSLTADDTVPADPLEAGRYWFSHAPANCSVCHSVEPEVIVVGPSLAGIATRGATRVNGLSAESYIRQSILDPGAYVVSGFPDAMARNLGSMLDSDQIAQIIAYLMTLE
ncbi:MAG: cytochrome c [Anaerolinea sp.]|nr:cytochrome c [Anaerolinea sp.]